MKTALKVGEIKEVLAANRVGSSDFDTVVAVLNANSQRLKDAVDRSIETMEFLRDEIVRVRPTGLLTVGEMAAAIRRDRNYVDSVWSNFGPNDGFDARVKGRQTRVKLADDPEASARTRAQLSRAADAQWSAVAEESAARTERDRNVALIYASKILGPSAIATAADIDRNHVLRIARKYGVKPVHRPGARNQYSR